MSGEYTKEMEARMLEKFRHHYPEIFTPKPVDLAFGKFDAKHIEFSAGPVASWQAWLNFRSPFEFSSGVSMCNPSSALIFAASPLQIAQHNLCG